MENFTVTGFTKNGVWVTVVIRTIRECVKLRALEMGIVEITNISGGE